MNRFPLWKNILIVLLLVVGLVYTLPNFFGEVPAVQISPVRAAEKIDTRLLERVESNLKAANIATRGIELSGNSIKARFDSTDVQIKAKDVLQSGLGDGYTVALNLVSASPAWLTAINALPMYLGLDLRGGVHFLLEVDMAAALDEIRHPLPERRRTLNAQRQDPLRGISRDGQVVTVHLRTRDQRDAAIATNLSRAFPI
jgi:preprotein translocase subunit SecD